MLIRVTYFAFFLTQMQRYSPTHGLFLLGCTAGWHFKTFIFKMAINRVVYWSKVSMLGKN